MKFDIRLFKLSFIFLVVISIVSCKNKGSEHNKDMTLKNSKRYQSDAIDMLTVDKVKLTLYRGAFHWDSFELVGNKLSYIPSDQTDVNVQLEYQKASTVILADSIVNSLIKGLLAHTIFEMDSIYDNETSDNSLLAIELILNKKKKKIKCTDFDRGCPEVLKNLEKKIIELHGKNLKRIWLPG